MTSPGPTMAHGAHRVRAVLALRIAASRRVWRRRRGARCLTILRMGLCVLLCALVTQGGCTWLTTPSRPFGAYAPPPAPDYADERNWAALPQRKDAADDVPPCSAAVDSQDTAPADVFFVHPTTYFAGDNWNAPADDFWTRVVTATTLAGQASAFNGAGRIYAPRYRQMTLAGFAHPDVRELALARAYGDVSRAFRHYLVHYNDGRPIVLAGHSQGSRLVLRLLDEFFAAGPLRARLVAAYPVGARVWEMTHARGEATVPICREPTQTGCLVTWRTFADGADASLDRNPGEPHHGRTVCVNPLTWRFDEIPAPPAVNLGSIGLVLIGGPGRVRPALVGAQCRYGFLWIDPPKGWGFSFAHADGNYHAYDYALFYMNIRENAQQRVAAFMGSARSLR